MSNKKSGSARFMDCVMVAMAPLAALCLMLYYADIVTYKAILWTGITAFTILYHFWVRIVMGLLTKHFPIHHGQAWFREHRFERGLYRFLRVRRWKEKVLTYDPASFSLKDHTLEEIANTMCRAEVDHWINELISLTTLLFAIPWGAFPIFLVTAIAAMLFDAQFIVVQRFNRPIVLRVIEKKKRREAHH